MMDFCCYDSISSGWSDTQLCVEMDTDANHSRAQGEGQEDQDPLCGQRALARHLLTALLGGCFSCSLM